MQIDQAVLLAVGGALSSAIGALFWTLVAAKDAHIAELRETIRYQRTVAEVMSGTAHRAVGTVERLAS